MARSRLPGVISVAVAAATALVAPSWAGTPAGRFLAAPDIAADLDLFREQVIARSAYLILAPYDVADAVGELRQHAAARGGLTVAELAAELQRILAATGDPGARILGSETEGPFLPFAIVPLRQRYVAFWHDGAGFLAPGKPYLTDLAGDPVNVWLGSLDALLPAGPPGYRRRIGLDYLQAFGAIKREAGGAPDSAVTVTVAGPELTDRQEVAATLHPRRAGKVVWPQRNSAELPGKIGYLRLARMDSRAVDQIRRWMPKFERTEGLIVDLRGNGGGPRDALRELHPYFLRFDDPPLVAAATLYRAHAASRPDDRLDMTGRPADWPDWPIAEAAAISAFQEAFAPADSNAAAALGPWRYLVVSREDRDPRYPYLNPIVLLMDGGCGGSTELLLGSCKGRFKVTLIGTPSSGVPDGAEAFDLLRSGLRVQVSSLLTFLPDGSRLGEAAIEPDILSYLEPESFLPEGEDIQLEFARKYLLAR